MLSLGPNITPQDTNNTFTLLNLVTDGEKYKARLNELLKAVNEANEKLKAAKLTEANAKQLQANANTTMTEAKRLHAEAVEKQNAAVAHLQSSQKLQADTAAREKQLLADDQARRVQHQSAVKEVEAVLNRRDAELVARVAQLKDAQTALEADRKNLAEQVKTKTAALENQTKLRLAKEAELARHEADLKDRLAVLHTHMQAVQSVIKA